MFVFVWLVVIVVYVEKFFENIGYGWGKIMCVLFVVVIVVKIVVFKGGMIEVVIGCLFLVIF